ncbi:MAG: rhodanese-like domain-containing protein [Methylococcaceae bacterium]|nr:rhodanese-like domain-containing protein [Methylococcaceae bacterium]
MKKTLLLASTLLVQACSHTPQTHIAQHDLLQQLKASMPIIIDVRSSAEYQAGHIPRAVHIPFWRAFTTDQLRSYSDDSALVLYCEHGPRAGIAKLGLWLQGFKNIRYLEGHMITWRKAGLPIE